MKSKLMSTSLALLSLTGFGEVMAEEGHNAFDVTLNAHLSKTVSADDVQIRLYHKNTQLSEGRITVDLQQGMDGHGNMLWGGSGRTVGDLGIDSSIPFINPENIYVAEIYSNNPVTYNKLTVGCQNHINLRHSSGDQNQLTGVCGISYALGGADSVYSGNAGQVPNKLSELISSPSPFTDVPSVTYPNLEGAAPGDALYFPVAFYAHLPKYGSDTSKYQPGLYTGNGAMVITASWA